MRRRTADEYQDWTKPELCRAVASRVNALNTANDRVEALEAALNNCRLLAAKKVTSTKETDPDWRHVMRFCTEAGIVGSVLRASDDSAGSQP